ncbi:hypothetical protein BCR37DRAFT_382621 [Protomyces lactucae-debilis]|uniref:Uncharacterized protein n=1 Tax=Protomyces lactucae-debilis TaxID=2754530 RepID=A0A1Y2F1Z6_PROLT|nr:uncharacterized protein BCR37DRAFT_382621 [Protomyces lactucae-debilis]ORY77727.1 hypothetical protein BCR37DRAFT_382621 [Protomyces lactucae-debilis]
MRNGKQNLPQAKKPTEEKRERAEEAPGRSPAASRSTTGRAHAIARLAHYQFIRQRRSAGSKRRSPAPSIVASSLDPPNCKGRVRDQMGAKTAQEGWFLILKAGRKTSYRPGL